MASQQQIEGTYDYIDEFLRLSLGECQDFSCAYYNGDFTKSLEQAQKDKHDYILKNLKFRKGMRILDIGCGWGPVLKAVQEKGGKAVGVTLSPAQVAACKANGLQAYIKDWENMNVKTFGKFDAIASVGAFEHFCSPEEHLAGKQDKIYTGFFKLCNKLLPEGGRLFLQTFVWDKNVPNYRNVSLKTKKDSVEYIIAMVEKIFPGSWLPYGKEQIIKNAKPYFKLVSANSGKNDYIETTRQWGMRALTPSLAKIPVVAKLMLRYIRDNDFRLKIRAWTGGYFRKCFDKQIMNHYRMVFEKA